MLRKREVKRFVEFRRHLLNVRKEVLLGRRYAMELELVAALNLYVFA